MQDCAAARGRAKCHMLRRRFLAAATLTAATTPFARLTAAASPAPAPLTDVNLWVDAWVVRSAPTRDLDGLLNRLRRHGVTSGWAGSFEGVLHTDLAGANERLVAQCARAGGLLLPFGTVNPTFPDWEEDLRRCHEQWGMRGIRVFPNYHGYDLADPRFAQLMAAAAARRLVVQIVATIEDERSQNPALVAPPVPLAPLPDLLRRTPGARVMLLNAASRVVAASNPLARRLVDAGVVFELSTLETVAGIENALRNVSGLRFSFGSHAPYFYFEAALLKLRESALTADQEHAIRHGHAATLLA
jgi:hypothetical protein